MYTRVTTFQADPARLSELTAKLPDIKDQVSEMDGLVDWYIVWRGDGHGLVFTVFQDNASAEASLAEVRGIWNDIMGLLKMPPKVENFDSLVTLDEEDD
jgi:hypothetical protein